MTTAGDVEATRAPTPIRPLTDLSRALQCIWPGIEALHVSEIDSSNSELIRCARAGDGGPCLLVAARQTAGRGRLGRVWHGSEEGGGALTFSLGLPLAPRDWAGLSLAIGVSLAAALEPQVGRDVSLKWPNDLWVEGRKLGGILIETVSLPGDCRLDTTPAHPIAAPRRYVVIGVGLNLCAPDGDNLRCAPAWVREWQPHADPMRLLGTVAPSLLEGVLGFAERGFAAFAEAFAARDALRGREVDLSDGRRGVCAGVDGAGALLLQTEAGMVTVGSGDISVRPAAAPARSLAGIEG